MTSRIPRVVDIVVDAVARAGASTVFTAGEGAAATVALMEAAARDRLRVVHAAHASAACAMGCVTGLLTDGPGVAVAAPDGAEPEILAALEQAVRDAAPLVLVTDRSLSAPVEAIAKASLAVNAAAAAHWSAHACQLALSEPRGPVHLVVAGEIAASPAVPLAVAVRPVPIAAPDAVLLDRAADLLVRAQRPILVVGRQCRTREIAAWLRALAESVPAPVLVTPGGRGALPDPHPLNLGLVRDPLAVSEVVHRADLAVVIGADSRELPPGALPSALASVHLAASPWERVDDAPRLDVVGEIALLIEELAPRLRSRARADWDVAELDRLKRGLGPPRAESRLDSRTVVRIVREAMAAGTVAVVAAEGETESALAAWQTVAPREMVVSATPELRGFAVPAAIAAALARQPARVACFASARQLVDARDMLETAARLTLPVLLLIVGQRGEGAAGSLADLATRCAWVGSEARDEMGLRMAIEQALSRAGPALVDVRRPPA